LMKAFAHELAFDLVNLLVRDGPRKWNAQDIALHPDIETS